MARIAVCEGDFYFDWLGNFKCAGGQWNVDEAHLYNQVDLTPINTRLNNSDVFISAIDSRLSNLEGIYNGSIPAFDLNAIDSVIATQMFTAGFLLCAVPWAAFFGIAKILQAIREF